MQTPAVSGSPPGRLAALDTSSIAEFYQPHREFYSNRLVNAGLPREAELGKLKLSAAGQNCSFTPQLWQTAVAPATGLLHDQQVRVGGGTFFGVVL